MQSYEALEILSHLPPNIPGGAELPFSDKRFSKFWCPFHKGRKVWLQVYQPEWGGVVFTCSEACRDQQSIYSALHARYLRKGYDRFYFQVVVTRFRTLSDPEPKSALTWYLEDIKKWQASDDLVQRFPENNWIGRGRSRE